MTTVRAPDGLLARVAAPAWAIGASAARGIDAAASAMARRRRLDERGEGIRFSSITTCISTASTATRSRREASHAGKNKGRRRYGSYTSLRGGRYLGVGDGIKVAPCGRRRQENEIQRPNLITRS